MNNISVLAIDDDDIDLEALQRNLHQCDSLKIQFEGFQDWERGLEALSHRPADVIFLDFFLGNITGTEVLKELRARGDLRPVIMLTGQGDEDIATASMRFGASDYLPKKNLSPRSLMRAIETAHREYVLRMENAYLEQQLRSARHLEAIGTLAGGIAHDFNNFLAGIMASAEWALTLDPSPEVARELKRISSIVDNTSEVIGRLLNFSTLDTENEAMDLVDVREVANDTLQVLAHSAPKGIEIVPRLHEKPLYVRGSSAKLHQLILNLCVNAVEAMGETGQLIVALAPHEVHEEQSIEDKGIMPGKYVLAAISDTGPGIPDGVREKMFDPFFTTKDFGPKKGTGLGLSTVWECVRDSGGTIRVYTDPSQGTTFRVYIPVSGKPAEEAGGISSSSEELTGSETLIVVDDEQMIREMTGRLLQRFGYSVYVCKDGEAALDLWKSHPKEIALVLSDLSMPGIGGRGLLARLRTEAPTLPVILSTGHSTTIEGDGLTEAGAFCVLQKPYNITELARTIRTALDKQTRGMKEHCY